MKAIKRKKKSTAAELTGIQIVDGRIYADLETVSDAVDILNKKARERMEALNLTDERSIEEIKESLWKQCTSIPESDIEQYDDQLAAVFDYQMPADGTERGSIWYAVSFCIDAYELELRYLEANVKPGITLEKIQTFVGSLSKLNEKRRAA